MLVLLGTRRIPQWRLVDHGNLDRNRAFLRLFPKNLHQTTNAQHLENHVADAAQKVVGWWVFRLLGDCNVPCFSATVLGLLPGFCRKARHLDKSADCRP